MRLDIGGQGTFTKVHKGSIINTFRLAHCHLLQKDNLSLMNGKGRDTSPRLFTHTNTFKVAPGEK